MGAPFLAGGRGGLAVLESPSVGFILGFPLAAFFIGSMMNLLHNFSIFWAALCSSIFGGILILYIPGIIGLSMKTNLSIPDAAFACLIFIPGDFIKAILAAVIVKKISVGLPSIFLKSS